VGTDELVGVCSLKKPDILEGHVTTSFIKQNFFFSSIKNIFGLTYMGLNQTVTGKIVIE